MDRKHILDREHFYHFPPQIDLIHDNATYLSSKWFMDARLRRYINKRIPEDYSSLQVLAIAQILVSEVCQLPPLVGAAAPPQRGCITALLAYILFRHPELGRKTQNQLRTSIFERLQPYLQGLEFGDIYQTGLELISEPANFLQNFRPELDWYFSLIEYSHSNFLRSLGDELRSKLRNRNLNRSNLGILNACSSSLLKKLLILWGEQEDRRCGLVLLHECFQELVKAKQFITKKTQTAHYDNLLARYRERSVGVNFKIADLEQVTQLLDLIAESFRQYKQLKPISLDFKLGDETTLGELQADTKQTNVIEDLEKSELQELAVKLLDEHEIDRQLLLFLYGLEMTQEEAAIEFDCHQTTIGRPNNSKLSRLLVKFANKLHVIDPDSSLAQGSITKIIDNYINYLKYICEYYYYPELLSRILAEIVESASSDSNIERIFIDRLETQWQFKFKPDGVGVKKAVEFVQRRLNLPSFYPDELPM